jgi:drug/metabolite transporter (DMT)-like permease
VFPFELLLVAVVGLNVWADFMDRRAAIRSDANALSLWTTITQFILVIPIVGLTGLISFEQLLVCAIVGAFTAWARIPWYRALSMPGSKLSRLAPFTRLSSVMVLVMAYTFLGEPFSPTKFMGALAMVLGALTLSLDRSFTSLRDYFTSNYALLLVLIFASSMAATSVFYKYMLNAGVSAITIYFFLKLFQCVSAVLYGYSKGILRLGFSAIVDLQLFVQARAIQTLAAFLYLFVLRRVDLSTVEPIAAAIGPIIYFSIDAIEAIRAKANEPPPLPSQSPPKRSLRSYVAFAGTLVIAVGLYFVIRG